MRLYKVRHEEFPFYVCPDPDEETIFSIPLNKGQADPYDLDDQYANIDEFMLRGDIRTWLDKMFGPDFYDYDAFDGVLQFKESKDLMLFKLKWLGSCTCTPLADVNEASQTYLDI